MNAPTSKARSALVVLVAAGALFLALRPAEAKAQMYLGLGLGPAVQVDDWPNQVRIEEEIGWYVTGSRSGFFVGFSPAQSFGNDFWILTFPLRLGGMFNIFRNQDVTFQLGPTGTIGFAASNFFDARARDADPWFHFSVAFMFRLLVANERVALYLRPLDFEFAIGDSFYWRNEAIRYVLAGGVQFYL